MGRQFDFAYVNEKKIEILLSQQNEIGRHISRSVTTGETSGKSGSVAIDVRAGAGPAGGGLGGNLGLKVGGDGGVSRVEAISANPYWNSVIELIDYARSITSAEPSVDIHRMIHVVGGLKLHDAATLSAIALDPGLAETIRSIMPNAYKSVVREDTWKALWALQWKDFLTPTSLYSHILKRKRSGAAPGKEAETDLAFVGATLAVELVLSGLRKMPVAMFGEVDDEHHSYWFTLRKEGLLSDYSDVALKHGSTVPGLWSMVCIVDTDGNDRNVPDLLDAAREMKSDEAKWNISHATDWLFNAARKFVGRPEGKVGVTPIVIYRQLAET